MSSRRIAHPPETVLAFAALMALGVPTLLGAGSVPIEKASTESEAVIHNEVPDDPPGTPARAAAHAVAAGPVSFGRFTHYQVNVSAGGADIIGDAANEPSLAVDPTDPNRMAIGWRQFDTIASNFREAGFAFTVDGGQTWTAGTIDDHVFRSDPVLGHDVNGRFYYNSLSNSGGFSTSVFPSTDGGATWGTPVFAYGGDKQWMAIDRTGGATNGNVYEAWSTASNPHAPNTFTRSLDQGQTYQSPSAIPTPPIWGTLDVAPDGTVYVAGSSGPGSTARVARSINAGQPGTPAFTVAGVNLGGTIQTGGPNPAGLLGQVWVAADPSPARSGWVYLLCSVRRPNDPMDVMFSRSTNHGQTWSAPVRVNDDAGGTRAFQWFGTMSVSPNGRIDAVWNDTRGSSDSTMSALYYSYSTDGGVTWSANEQASPVWNSTIGWPNQNKIGDYYHMVSRDGAADLAWAATFHGGEDVYHVRIPFLPAVAVADDPRRGVSLHDALPNPFATTTAIAFELSPGGANAALDVFDPAGRHVATLVRGFVGEGAQIARWNGTDDAGRPVRAGLYLYRLETRGHAETRKVMLLR